jgi:predicted phosphodiesterase
VALLLNQLVFLSVAEITIGPYLGNVTTTSITISWETDRRSSGIVEYAKDEQYQQSGEYDEWVESRFKSKRHKITLSGLAPSTLYHYRIISGSDVGVDNTFLTSVGLYEPFSFAVYGDTRTNHDDHQAVVDSMVENQPYLVMNSGDLVENGRSPSQWDIFFDITKDLMKSAPYYPVLGNHEANSILYYNFFSLPEGGGKSDEEWYSFDYGNTHFICLNSNSRHSIRQLVWLKRDLENASEEYQWIIVVFHHPVYSSGKHGGEYASMHRWINLFEDYGVDMVFNGHDHLYERSYKDGIWYIVTGGGGAPLYSVNQNPNPYQVYAESILHFCKLNLDGAYLELRMIRPDGTVGDTFSIDKR